MDMQYKFGHAIVGGTFDRFHAGHRKLLTEAFENSEKVTIGIATEELFGDKSFKYLIEEYKDREQSVSDFLKEKGFESRTEIIPIHNIFGNSLESKNIDAIFVTESTKPNAEKINEERKKKFWDPLEIITVSYVLGEDDEIISSERIRKGLIDREGHSYMKFFKAQKEFHLPQHEREALRRPIGHVATDMQTVIKSLDKHTMLIAVGDIVASSAKQTGRLADISIIDGLTRRAVLEPEHVVSFGNIKKRKTHNPAGSITYDAARSLQEAITDYETTHAEQLIVVSGEEDLLAIPAILLAPLKSVVLYGQFDQGIVVVHVSEQNKKRVQDLFWKFK
jgi:pantetheine-phosphate adenylyltransferase